MSEERIIITVDDAELDMAIAKLQQAATLSTMTLGTPRLSQGTRKLKQDLRGFGLFMKQVDMMDASLLERFGAADLPSINRNMRIIIGQVPGMRLAMQYYFRIKWLQAGVGKLIEDQTFMPLALTVIATALMVLQQVIAYQKQLERERRQYESYVRGAKKWTHEEFIRGRMEMSNYIKRLPG